jgi:glutathione S-transferase
VQITTACMLRYLQMTDPELLPRGRYPALEALSARCEARPEFQATFPADVVYPKSG